MNQLQLVNMSTGMKFLALAHQLLIKMFLLFVMEVHQLKLLPIVIQLMISYRMEMMVIS